MAITAAVKDGKLEYDYTDSSKKTTEAKGSNLGYDEFLQLLCAEMQYQDPLEPTSNTDYVAQLATFSQLEATLSMENTEQSSMANSLVGKQVILKTTNSATGATSYVDGRVDYVMYQNSKVYLSVNNSLYPLEDLDTVADSDYYEALALAKTFTKMVAELPELEHVTANSKSMIESVRKIYDDMTDYQKQYVDASDLKTLTDLETRLQEITKNSPGDTDSTDSDKKDGTTTA